MSLTRQLCGCLVEGGALGAAGRIEGGVVLSPCRQHAAVLPADRSNEMVVVPRYVLESVLRATRAFSVSGPGIDALRAILNGTPAPPETSGMAVWEGTEDSPQG